jgi:ribosomal protein L15
MKNSNNKICKFCSQEKKLIDADCKRVKILADGDLDKALVVEANSFSLQAIKMITLTGGHALKIQNEGTQDAEDNDDAE